LVGLPVARLACLPSGRSLPKAGQMPGSMLLVGSLLFRGEQSLAGADESCRVAFSFDFGQHGRDDGGFLIPISG